VVAYQHSPIGAQATNDASMLLPEHALKQDHIVASYKDGLGSLSQLLLGDRQRRQHHRQLDPAQNTLAGAGVPAVNANATGQVVMNRFDTMEVRAPNSGDLSGTFVSADKPIWVVGAVNCVNVPTGVTFCDHIEEQMLPLDYWGKKYVGAHSPKRGTEKHYWRVYGGENGTVVTTNPVQPGTPLNLNKGQWVELAIANNTSFIFESDKPFLPVQYLAGTNGGAGTGDPAMYQMIPVEQFLDSYAFVTGTGYTQHYAQIIRLKGGADVLDRRQRRRGLLHRRRLRGRRRQDQRGQPLRRERRPLRHPQHRLHRRDLVRLPRRPQARGHQPPVIGAQRFAHALACAHGRVIALSSP
jgi:hypothetical protein